MLKSSLLINHISFKFYFSIKSKKGFYWKLYLLMLSLLINHILFKFCSSIKSNNRLLPEARSKFRRALLMYFSCSVKVLPDTIGKSIYSTTKKPKRTVLKYRTTSFRATSYYLAHGIFVVRTKREVVLFPNLRFLFFK